MQGSLQYSDLRAAYVLIFSSVIVGGAWWFNAALVYDDIGFPVAFSNLVNELGWFNALIKICCLDLPNEYRTYGLSRVIQFLIWSLGGATASVYAVLISLSELVTVLALYGLLVSLRIERVVALSMGLMWLFSPFIWTSCFHHYSYLILPIQIMIIGSFFLIKAGVQQKYFLAVFMGFALALTGELHLIVVPFILIMISVASGDKHTIRASILAIFTMMLTVFTHHLIWKLFVADNAKQHRFSFDFFNDMSHWGNRIFAAVETIGQSIIEQLGEIAGDSVIWFITAMIISSFIVYFSFSWALDGRGQKDIPQADMPKSSSLILAGILFVAACMYLAVYVMVSVLSDNVWQVMPRRYGYIPLTVMLSAISLAAAVLLSCHINKRLIFSILIGVIIALFIRHQVIILPSAKAADNDLSSMISRYLKEDPSKAVLFFNASEKIFPRVSVNAGSPGPLMRSITSTEISISKYGTYWPAYLNVTKELGAPFTCELGDVVENEELALVCPSWQSNSGTTDGSKVIIVANLGFDSYDPFGKQVQVFRNYQEFKPYFFARQIVRNINLTEFLLDSDVVAINMGLSSLKSSSEGVFLDKNLDDPISTQSRIWLKNYGWLAGEDRVNTFQDASIPDSGYYGSNRQGSFEYAFQFSTSDVTIDLDFLELWGNKPGERLFSIHVSWNEGKWVSLGVIDVALINGDKPLSVRLSHQKTHSFAFRLAPVAGSQDVPFIQGVRISRRKPLDMKK